MAKYRIRNNTFLGEFLISFINDDPNNVLINAYNNFPHAVPLMTGFSVTELSKEILKNYTEAIIRDQGVIFEDVDLPFNYVPEDYMIVYDTYTLFDDKNQNSILVNNFFYNPTLPNYNKVCLLRQLLNKYAEFKRDHIIINKDLLNMLRRIRFVENIENNQITFGILFFNVGFDPLDVNDISDEFTRDINENNCIHTVTYIGNMIETGDYDNESRIGNITSASERRGVNMNRRRPFDPITVRETIEEDIDDSDNYEESESEDDDAKIQRNYELYGDKYIQIYNMDIEDFQRLYILWALTFTKEFDILMKNPVYQEYINEQIENLDEKPETYEDAYRMILRTEIPINTKDVYDSDNYGTLIFFDNLNFRDIPELKDLLLFDSYDTPSEDDMQVAYYTVQDFHHVTDYPVWDEISYDDHIEDFFTPELVEYVHH